VIDIHSIKYINSIEPKICKLLSLWVKFY
jgi:hypothetical protein